MWENIQIKIKMELEFIFGTIEQDMKDNLKIICSKDSEFIFIKKIKFI